MPKTAENQENIGNVRQPIRDPYRESEMSLGISNTCIQKIFHEELGVRTTC